MEVLFQYVAALASSLGAFCAGSVIGWSAPANKLAGNYSSYDFNVTETDLSWLGSIIGVGAASICLIGGSMIDMIGRKATMLIMLIPFTVGWSLVIFAENVTYMIIGRLFLGVGCGGICCSAPMYIGEISQKEIRGILSSFFQLMITIGIMCTYFFGMPQITVKTFSIICAIFPFIFGACIAFCPETPTFWVKKGRRDRAIQSLRWLRGKDYDFTDEISDLMKEEHSKRNESLSDALKRRSTIKGLYITNGLMFFQQMCGINAVIFFQTSIFAEAESGLEPWISTILVGAVQVVATSASTMTLDKLGRRILLLISGAVMAMCTTALGVFFMLKERGDADHLSWLPVTSVCVFIVAFSVGYGPVPWVIQGEIFSADIKGLAGSLAACLNWLLAFTVGKTYKDLSEWLGIPVTFYIYSVLSLLGVVFVLLAVPETKNKSLSEIQEMLGED